MSASEVAAAMAKGLRGTGLVPEELPLADGGDGTMDALTRTLGGELVPARVTDPLGRPIEARFARLPDGRAVVEVAAASGLTLVAAERRDAWAATSWGTGELIAAAARAGARRVLVAAGGSAGTDGGIGAIEALREAHVAVELTVLCDVRIPFERAAPMFAPQKGADPGTVARLERRLEEIAAAAPRDPRGVPLTGAAGGLAGGLWAHLGAELVPGAGFVLDQLGFDARLAGSALVLTGEGRLDRGSLAGKLVSEVAIRCRRAGVPCCAIVGASELPSESASALGLAGVVRAGDPAAIAAAARRLGRGLSAT
jgi:glycerate kinase